MEPTKYILSNDREPACTETCDMDSFSLECSDTKSIYKASTDMEPVCTKSTGMEPVHTRSTSMEHGDIRSTGIEPVNTRSKDKKQVCSKREVTVLDLQCENVDDGNTWPTKVSQSLKNKKISNQQRLSNQSIFKQFVFTESSKHEIGGLTSRNLEVNCI